MHQGRRRDQGISPSSWVRHMQGRTAKRHGSVDGQNPIQELRQDVMGDPGPQPNALCSIATLDPENAKFNLHQRHRGEIEGLARTLRQAKSKDPEGVYVTSAAGPFKSRSTRSGLGTLGRKLRKIEAR
jgi:hypothetical protein